MTLKYQALRFKEWPYLFGGSNLKQCQTDTYGNLLQTLADLSSPKNGQNMDDLY